MKKGLGFGERRLPVAGCRLPVGRELPVAGCRLPVGRELPVAGCRLLVNGRWAGRTAIIMIVVFMCLVDKALGQELTYNLKIDQIITYQLMEEGKSHALRQTRISIFEFRVDSLSKTGAWMTLTPTRYFLQPGGNSELNSPAWFGDLNREILFHVTQHGEISQISGFDPIFNEVAEKIRNDKSSADPLAHYNILKLRYSAEYYEILIRQFFPNFYYPGAHQKNIPGMSYGDEAIYFGLVWNEVDLDSSTSQMKFFKPGVLYWNMKNESLTQARQIIPNTHGSAHWSKGKSLLDTIKFQGFNLPELLVKWIQGNPSNNLNLIEEDRFLSNHTIQLISSRQKSFVNLSFKAIIHDTTRMNLYDFRDPIDTGSWPCFFPGSKDTAKFGYKLPIDKPGILTAVFSPDMGTVMNSGNVFKLRIYAEPGDTIQVNMNQQNPEEVVFSGAHHKENILLNRWFAFDNYLPEGYTKGHEYAIQVLKKDQIELERITRVLDPDFADRLTFELKYQILKHELFRMIEKTSKAEWGESRKGLDYFKPFLNQLKFNETSTYFGFLQAYLAAQQSVAGLNFLDNTIDYPTADLFLTGWDRYFFHSKWISNNIYSLQENRFRKFYDQYRSVYGETPFGRQIRSLYAGIEKFKESETLSGLKLDTYTGHPLVISFNYHKSKEFMDQFVGYVKKINKTDLRYIQYLSLTEFDSVAKQLFFKYSTNDEEVVTSRTKSEIELRYLTDSLKLRFGLNDNFPLLLLDRDGKFFSFQNPDHFDPIVIKNLESWPQSKSSKVKTINLTIFWYSLAGSSTLAIIIILAIRIRSKRREARMNLKRKIAQLEVDAVRSRMNPHFLFNALGSIQNLVNRGKNQEASQYLARFGDLVRTILTQSSKPVIGLDEEIGMIRNYLELEQLGSPFVFDIRIDPAIDPATLEVPPLLIQPHVENAVIHGISSLGAAGKIGVNFHLEKDHLICEVTDNGAGYHPGAHPEKVGLGQGWTLTRQRIQLMKEQYGEEVSAEVTAGIPTGDGSPEISGTTVTFRLPMQKSTT